MAQSALQAAYRKLPADAAGLYRLLGFCPVEWIDPQGLAVLVALPVTDATRLAGQLLDAGLLGTVEHGYALDSAQRMHARLSVLAGAQERIAAEGVNRVFEFLRSAAAAAEQLITPTHRALWPEQATDLAKTGPAPFGQDELAALDWLAAQLPNYMAAIRYAFVVDQNYRLVCELAHRLWPLWLRRRHPKQRYEAHQLGLAAARLLDDDHACSLMLTTLAGALRGTRPVEAYECDRRAVLHSQRIADCLGAAQALNGLGKNLLATGHLEQADTHFRDAERLRRDAGYTRGVALSRQGRGLVALARGDGGAAAEHLLAAYRDLLAVEDHYDAAITQAYHAEALAALADPRALVELESASLELRSAGSAYGQALTFEIKARILANDGRQDAAAAALEQALALFTDTDPPSAERVQQRLDARGRVGRSSQ